MQKPVIRKLGTIECDLVEATPVVFDDRLYRFEYVRDFYYKPNTTGDSYFRFVDVETGECTRRFAVGFHLGSAYVEGEVAYVYGVEGWGRSTVHVFRSNDLEHWTSQPALEMEGWRLYNNSVCKGPDRYVMAFEVGEPADVVGKAFTNYFAESGDLLKWRFMGLDHVFSKDRYTACPALRFHRGFYYMFYLECTRSGEGIQPEYETFLVRTSDFLRWETSPLNPVLAASDEDRRIRSPYLNGEHRDRIAEALNINNSDFDLCEHKGRVVIFYSWGNQKGIEHLAEATFDGTRAQFLDGFFPAGSAMPADEVRDEGA